MGLSRGRGMFSIWRFGSRRWGSVPNYCFSTLFDLIWHFDSQVIKNQVKEKAIFLGGRILKFKRNTETGKDDRSYFLDEEGPNILYCSIFRYEYDLWGSCGNISKISRYFVGPRHNIWDRNINIPIFRQYIGNLADFLEFINLSSIFRDIFGPLNARQAILWGDQHRSGGQSSKMCWFFCHWRDPKDSTRCWPTTRANLPLLIYIEYQIYSLKFIILK